MPTPIIIYGASTSAHNLYYTLKQRGITPVSFAVSDTSKNPLEIEGVKVRQIEDLMDYRESARVLLAVPPSACMEISRLLDKLGFQNYEFAGLDSPIDLKLRKSFFQSVFRKAGKAYIDINEFPDAKTAPDAGDFRIFMVLSHHDQPASNQEVIKASPWLVPIQAGAAQTERKLADCQDHLGPEQISDRNRNYCELSAAYWIWKSVDIPYIGLCHYRRHFSLSPETISRFKSHNFDVLLPHWGLYRPDVRTAYHRMANGRAYFDQDFDLMMDAVSRVAPSYVQAAKEVETGCYFLHYNMLVAKKAVWRDYCDFLFSVLFAVESYYQQRGIDRQDRYLGYLGEVLTTIYFLRHTQYQCAFCDLIQWDNKISG